LWGFCWESEPGVDFGWRKSGKKKKGGEESKKGRKYQGERGACKKKAAGTLEKLSKKGKSF